MSRIQGITFDIYGTLINPGGTTWEAVNQILTKVRADADRELFFGRLLDRVREGCTETRFRTYYQIFQNALVKTFEELGVPGSPEDVDLIFAHSKNCKPYPEVPSVLSDLQKQIKTGVVSNADNKPLRMNLEDAQISFEFLVTSESMQAYKPALSLFEEALRRLSLEPRQVLHVGDSPHEDIAPAKTLGMTAVWINRSNESYPADLPSPDHVISSLSGLTQILD